MPHQKFDAAADRSLIGGVKAYMPLRALMFTAVLMAAPVRAQQPPPPPPAVPSISADTKKADESKEAETNLPVSLDKIREQLQQAPAISLRSVEDQPIFRVQILERRKIEELLATLNFKAGPIPAGGVHMFEQQRQMFNPVDHPLMQPYSAFGTGELLTLLVENLIGQSLGPKIVDAVSKSARARAAAAARDEVYAAVAQYCNAQPNAGAGIYICANPRR